MTHETDIYCAVQKCRKLIKSGKSIHEVRKTGVIIHICDSCHKGTGETGKIKKMKIKLKKRK